MARSILTPLRLNPSTATISSTIWSFVLNWPSDAIHPTAVSTPLRFPSPQLTLNSSNRRYELDLSERRPHRSNHSIGSARDQRAIRRRTHLALTQNGPGRIFWMVCARRPRHRKIENVLPNSDTARFRQVTIHGVTQVLTSNERGIHFSGESKPSVRLRWKVI